MEYKAQFLENRNLLFSTNFEAMSPRGALRQAVILRRQFVTLGNENRPYKDKETGEWVHLVIPQAIEIRVFSPPSSNGRPRAKIIPRSRALVLYNWRPARWNTPS